MQGGFSRSSRGRKLGVYVCVLVLSFKGLGFWRQIYACVDVPASGQSSESETTHYLIDKLLLVFEPIFYSVYVYETFF